MLRTSLVLLITIPIVIQCVHISHCPNSQYLRKRVNKDNAVNSKLPKCDSNFPWWRLDNLKQWKRRKRCLVHCGVYDNAVSTREKRRAIEFDDEVYQENVDELSVLSPTLPTSSLSLVSRFKEQWPVGLWLRYGMFTEDYLFEVNGYWLQFPPPHPAAHYSLGSLYLVIMTVGCSGNVLVLAMYFRCRSLRTPGNILVANLALSDFLMLVKTPIFVFNSFNLGPAMGKTGCVLYGFVGGLTGVTSIATLTAIALDRYWAVARPLEGLRALTGLRARLLALAAWLYAAAFALVPALHTRYGHYAPEGYLTSCSFDYLTQDTPPRYFIFLFFCAAWLAPFCTITFCYLNIFRVVACDSHRIANDLEHRLSSRHVKEQVKRKAEIKLAFLVIVVIALFFVSWTPYAIVSLLGIFGRKDLITPLSSMVPALFCKTAACINPFIYLITHPKFRKEFKKVFFGRKRESGGGTMKTIGYTEGMRARTPSKDLSDTDVEVVEMRNIPFQHEQQQQPLQTISSRVAQREDSQKSSSIKSLNECAVSPPSWYSKPQFTKKKSFHRHSIISITSNPKADII